MGKLKKYFCLLIAVVLLASVSPSVALADDPVAPSTKIYVSATPGSDLDADEGTRGNPYQTLAEAAEAIEADKGDAKHYTIYIMSDLTMTTSARFWKHDVSIQSDPEAESKQIFTLSRAATGFDAAQDPARGGYNPALSEYTRIKGETGSNGPAGAVWIQSGNFEMKDGAEISNLNGRAIYMDGGSATVGGTISDITANKNAMWEGEDGTVLHLRNKATATLTASGEAVNCTGGNMVIVNEATFTMDAGSLLGNSDAAGIKTNEDAPSGSQPYDKTRNTVIVNGMITGIQNNKNPIQFKYGTLTIGEDGEICGNTGFYGAIYLQRDADVHIYGKIYNNITSGRGGGIGCAGHGPVDITMYDSAEIYSNNSQEGGGGLCLANCTFTMEGGSIYNNSTVADGGGVLVRKGATFIMKAGTITGNACQGVGGGVAYESNEPLANVQLIGGEVSNNKMYRNQSNEIENDVAVTTTGTSKISGFMTINSSMTIDYEKIFFEKYNFSIERPGKGVKFGNAATGCENAVKQKLESENLTQVVGSMW